MRVLLSTSILTLCATSCGVFGEPDFVSASDRAGERAAGSSPMGAAPRAAVRPYTVVAPHGHERVDPYYWMNQREDPEVLAHLAAENAYLAAQMSHTEELQATLFEEMKGRLKQDDSTVPSKDRDYLYYQRFEEGQEYPILCRCPADPATEGQEQVMLDQNALAQGHSFFSLRGSDVSAGQQHLAYATDTRGRRIYEIRVRDLRTGEDLPDLIPNATGNMAWAEDDCTLFYARQDPLTLRSFRIFKHILGTDPADDELVFEETDEEFSCRVSKTRSRRFLVIHSSQTLSTEARVLPADQPDGSWRVIEPRHEDHEYSVDHYGDHFYVVSNHEAQNFKLMRTPVDATGMEHWEEVLPHREDALLERIQIFRDHLVVSERSGGLPQMHVMPWDGGAGHYLEFPDATYSARFGTNNDFDTTLLRIGYSSLTTPNSVLDYDLVTRETTLLKQDEVLGGFDPSQYHSERILATARDGTAVPISLVSRVGTPRDGSAPLLLYGYGSYGNSSDASFRPDRLSLIDRGFVFALAHIRGGSEMGRQWYEDGKLMKKMNTFTDFLDCADHLVAGGYADPEKVFAMGGSAGGLLMGAVINLRPDRFRGVVAAVPFVDVVTTMLDDSIPLTTFEYDEWGNPNEAEAYHYMLSYSPYDNVEAKDYPNLLVTTGLHDSQVQYFEPAKWVAKLRATKTDDNRLLFHTNLDAGHGGASGRFRRLKETALQYAFFLDLAAE